MKTYGIYSVILVLGIVLGAILFGNQSSSEEKGAEVSITDKNLQIWTCAMHPEVRQVEKGNCPICAMELTPVARDENVLSDKQFQMTEHALALANVQTIIVGKTQGNGVLQFSGNIVENEKTYASQTAHFAGRIEKLYINSTGEAVKKGQLLALVYSPELTAAQQELLTASKTAKSQPQLYAAVRNKLKIWKLSEKQINTIVSSGKVITNFPIYANVSGVVAEKHVAAGDHIMEGHTLFTISNLASVWAVFEVYEDQIATVRIGQHMRITPQAYPEMEVVGTITFIDPILNATSRTVAARVVLENKKGLFKPGMFVQGRVASNTAVTETKNKHLMVPKSAVLWTGKRSLVYVKVHQEKPIFEMREVSLGQTNEESYVIAEGLKSGEEIVVNGTFTIDAAAQLQGKKSMMN